MNIIVLGIGNTLAGDDGLGIQAVEQVRNTISDERVCFAQSERGGLDLLDLLDGHSTAFIIDVASTGTNPPGTITSFFIRRPYAVETLPSLHTIGLRTVLAFGTAMGIGLPEKVTVYTVEAKDIETFREGLSSEVECAIQDLTSMLVCDLQALLPDLSTSRVKSRDVKEHLSDTTLMEFV